MDLSLRLAATSFVIALATAGCAVDGDTNDHDEVVESTEDALSSLPAGRYVLAREPSSGSHVSELTLSAGRKFELELVRVTTSYEAPWWNPFLRLPVRKEEAIVARGTYFLFESDGEPHVSFDFAEGSVGHLSYGVEIASGMIRLHPVGGGVLELRKTASSQVSTDARVYRCTGRSYDAVIELDEAQHRRGTFTVKRHPGTTGGSTPPSTSFTVVYDGDTGVDDYMGYEGTDDEGGHYDFALRRSDLARTSGRTSNVGVGYTPEFAAGAWHASLECTIETR